MKKRTRLYLLIAILVIVGIVVATSFNKKQEGSTIVTDSASGIKIYTNNTYGFSFLYPAGYLLTERAVTSTSLAYSIAVARQQDLPVPQNSETPPAINIDIYNYSATGTLVQWLEQHPETNFSPTGGNAATTTLTGGIPAVAYRWSGLYEGEDIAIAPGRHAIVFTGTYINPNDQIKKDFESLISSVQILP